MKLKKPSSRVKIKQIGKALAEMQMAYDLIKEDHYVTN